MYVYNRYDNSLSALTTVIVSWPSLCTAMVFAMGLCSSSHQAVEYISPALQSGLFLRLSSANKMQWMMSCQFSRKLACFNSIFWTPVSAVRRKRLACWRMRDHVKQSWVIQLRPVQTSQPSTNPPADA